MNRALLFVAAIGMTVAACQDQQPVAPALPNRPVFQISDGHTGGNAGFFFLFPIRRLADDATIPATGFNADLSPVIEVYECAGTSMTGCVLPLGALKSRITKTSGTPLLNRLYVLPRLREYDALWDTRGLGLRTDRTYRIQVSVGGAVLGFADVDVVRTIKEAAAVHRDDFIPLLQNLILPIRFWVGNNALCAVTTAACASKTINLAQGGGIELLAAGEDFKVDIPPGTTASFGGQPVANVTFNAEVCSGIDVDLPKLGPCLRVSTFFDATGPGELEFSKKVLVSMCVLNSVYYTPAETRQQDLITLHQQDGSLIRALPHAAPNCTVIGTSGWDWLKSLAARFLAPQPAYAASRNAVLHVGAGGETAILGAKCTPAPTPSITGLMLTTVCPPTSPIVPSGPQRSLQATSTPPKTVSDFQFALPAKMDYLNGDDAARSAPAGTVLPTAVKVTDWDGAAVQGARVTFTEPSEAGGTIIGTATSNSDGVAQISWTIRAGSNTVVASGRGIAAQNNYPEATVKPFMPDIAPGVVQSPVALGTGMVTFTATGGAPQPIFLETFTDDAVDAPPGTPEIGSWSLTNPAGTILVRAAVGNLGAKPVELDHNAPGVAGSVALRGTTAGTPPTSGVYRASWRSLVHSTDACFNGIVLRDAASLIIASVEYRPGGALTYNSNTLNASAGTWTRDVSQLFEITADLNQKLTSLSIDGTPVASLQGVAFVQNAANIGQINMELGCVVSAAPQTYAWDDIVISRVSP